MTHLFLSHEKDFEEVVKRVQTDLNSRIDSLVGERRKNLVLECQRSLDEAREILDQMELQVKIIPSENRAKFREKFNGHQKTFFKLKELLISKSERKELLGEKNTTDPQSNYQRERLLVTNDKLNSQTMKLRESRKVAEETLEVGDDILRNLHEQRETLNRINKNLEKAESNVDQSSRILKRMSLFPF